MKNLIPVLLTLGLASQSKLAMAFPNPNNPTALTEIALALSCKDSQKHEVFTLVTTADQAILTLASGQVESGTYSAETFLGHTRLTGYNNVQVTTPTLKADLIGLGVYSGSLDLPDGQSIYVICTF